MSKKICNEQIFLANVFYIFLAFVANIVITQASVLGLYGYRLPRKRILSWGKIFNETHIILGADVYMLSDIGYMRTACSRNIHGMPLPLIKSYYDSDKIKYVNLKNNNCGVWYLSNVTMSSELTIIHPPPPPLTHPLPYPNPAPTSSKFRSSIEAETNMCHVVNVDSGVFVEHISSLVRHIRSWTETLRNQHDGVGERIQLHNHSRINPG